MPRVLLLVVLKICAPLPASCTTRIAVERASGHHVIAQSHVPSLRGFALAVGQWSSSVVTSLSWRSAVVEHSQFLAQASSSRGRRIWFLESSGQLCVWSKELLVEYHVFSAVIGAFAGLTSSSVRMHRKRPSRQRFVKDAASWFQRLVDSRSGPSSREATDPSGPGRVRFAPSASELVACGALFREENIGVLEARSILYAVRCAERNPLERFLILSDSFALAPALCKGRQNNSHCFESCQVDTVGVELLR